MRWNGSWYIYIVAIKLVSTLEMCKEKPATAIKIYEEYFMTLDLQSSKKNGTKIMLILKISTFEAYL